jgi:hypothetical protein
VLAADARWVAARNAPSANVLSLGEDHEGVRVDPVVLHRLGRRLGLHELLKRGKVGDLGDQANTLRALGVLERLNGDSEGAEHLLALGCAQPVVDVINLVARKVSGRRAVSFSQRELFAVVNERNQH